MKTQCTVCFHARRSEIETALADKIPLREIAREFGIGKDSARRHRLHMTPIPQPPSVAGPRYAPCPKHPFASYTFKGERRICYTCSPWDGKNWDQL